MVVPLDPDDGITHELIAVGQKEEAPTEQIAYAVLLANRGRFDTIFKRMKAEKVG